MAKFQTTFKYSVFINCPFDDLYLPQLQAITFAVRDCGFIPRSGLERTDNSTQRLAKLVSIIGECQYSIHDLSRTEITEVKDTSGIVIESNPRFNMPFECGLALGARNFSTVPRGTVRAALIMDRDKRRYEKTLSDLQGHDIAAHGGSIEKIIECVRQFLHHKSGADLPGGQIFVDRFARFEVALDAVVDGRFSASEIRSLDYWGDYSAAANSWITNNPR
jgi:hypothetical protein